MNPLAPRNTLRFAGEMVHGVNECNPWPQPSVISRLMPVLGVGINAKEYIALKHHAIACMAFHRWQAQGSPVGQAEENWLAAEVELM